MLNEYSFIRIYKSLANGKAETKEILGLYSDLQAILGEDTPFAKWFKEDSPDRLGAAIAIDAVAHAIHQDGENTLHQIFPDAEYSIIKSELDKLAGLEKNNQIRQYNRGYFTTLLAEDSVFLLEKQLTQVGRTTREAILPAIKEYEKLYKAGLSSPAEILTLSRYYPDNEQYRATIVKLGLDNEDNHPVVVGGPASVEMIDREGHLITTEALDAAFTKFMANFRSRNMNILHSDVQIGWILPVYITKDGRVFNSGVDDKQLWVLGEIRGDTRIAKRVAQEVIDKNLRSYSIAGSALDVQDVQKGANSYKEVREMELSEITLCLSPDTKIWTKTGLKEIKDIRVGEFVYTHENRWKHVINTFVRDYSNKILRITFDSGLSISATPEHPVRKLSYDGKRLGTRYQWIEVKDIKVGDLVSSHTVTGYCDYCKTPLFKKLKIGMRNFCSDICKNSAPGNRLGQTIESGTFHIFREKKERRIRTPRVLNACGCNCGKLVRGKFALGHSTRMRSEEEKQRWTAKTTQLAHERALPRVDCVCSVCGTHFKKAINSRKIYCSHGCTNTALKPAQMRAKWSEAGFAQKMFSLWAVHHQPNKLEAFFQDFLYANSFTKWKYVGDGKKVIGKKMPDFWNSENKLIEIFGDYWHKDENPQNRIEYFKQFGYETLVIWEGDIKKNLESVLGVVQEFDGNSLSKIISIEAVDYTGKVYNLEVEEDNSYTTEACVAHNCEKGMNQGSNISIIKSESIMPSLDLILSSFKDELSPFSGAQIYVENTGEIPSVIIKADKYNSIIDMLVLELQKMLPENTSIIVKYDISDAIPVYKMQLVPIWTTPQTQREADHSFPAKMGEDRIVKESDKSYEEESKEINDSKKTEKAKNPHKFIAAEWTHKNGHPRCKICGDEEGMTKMCPGLNKEALQKMIEKDAKQGTPPRHGLVPKSGDPRHPERWVKPIPGFFGSRPKSDVSWKKKQKESARQEAEERMTQRDLKSMQREVSWPTKWGINNRTSDLMGEYYQTRQKVQDILRRSGAVPVNSKLTVWEHPKHGLFGIDWSRARSSDGENPYSIIHFGIYKGETQNMGKAIDIFKTWLKKEKELDSPGRDVLMDYSGRQSKLRQLLDEQGMPKDTEPKDLDKLRDTPVAEQNAEPWIVNEAGQEDGIEMTPEEKKKVRGEPTKITRWDS